MDMSVCPIHEDGNIACHAKHSQPENLTWHGCEISTLSAGDGLILMNLSLYRKNNLSEISQTI